MCLYSYTLGMQSTVIILFSAAIDSFYTGQYLFNFTACYTGFLVLAFYLVESVKLDPAYYLSECPWASQWKKWAFPNQSGTFNENKIDADAPF